MSYDDKEMENYEYIDKQESSSTPSFPSTTPEEISLIFKVVGEHGKKVVPNTPETIEDLKEVDDPLLQFLTLVVKQSMNSKEFQSYMYGCKQMLHLFNRTTGLTNAYLSGVAVGFFLAKPEMMPVGEGKIDSNKVM